MLSDKPIRVSFGEGDPGVPFTMRTEPARIFLGDHLVTGGLRVEVSRSYFSVDQISPVEIMRGTVDLRTRQRWNRKRRHR